MILRDLMAQHRLTAQALSDLSGISRRTIEHYTDDSRSLANAQAHIVVAIADALHVHPRDLIAEPPK